MRAKRSWSRGLLGVVALLALPASSVLAQGHNPQFGPLYPIVGWPTFVPGCNQGFQRGLNDQYPGAYDIARDPSDLPAEPLANGAELTLTTRRIEAYVAPGPDGVWGGTDDVKFNYLVFGGGHGGASAPAKLPAPFIRVREGNTHKFKLLNYDTQSAHLIDFHAIIGHRGGAPVYGAAAATVVNNNVVPAEGCATFTFRRPGLYVYHCVGEGTPGGIAHHMNNGMSGLILVEPRRDRDDDETLPFTRLTRRSKEFYLFQQDIYYSNRGDGVADYDEGLMMSMPSAPSVSVFNGRVGALFDHPAIAEAGKNATVYFGTAGGHISSLHGIGEIWDYAWPEGDILNPTPIRNTQTSLVPSAGSLVFVMLGNSLVPTELNALFGCQIPPNLALFVDHASPFFRRGALGAFATVGIGSAGDSAMCQ